MSWMNAARDVMSKYVPGFGKTPEISAAKPVEVATSVESGEVQQTKVESGSAVIAKAHWDREKREIVPGQVSEDTVFADDELGVYGVADGVGAGGNGDVASREASAAFTKTIREGVEPNMTDHDRADLVREAMMAAGQAVATAIERTPGATEQMNTTFSAFLLDQSADGRRVATIGHVGDSRVYHYKAKERALIKHSRDDGMTETLTEFGVLDPNVARAIDQSVDEGRDVANAPTIAELQTALQKRIKTMGKGEAAARTKLEEILRDLERSKSTAQRDPNRSSALMLYSGRNVISDALKPVKGRELTHQLQIKTVSVESGDYLFAVSDGISDVLTEEEITAEIEQGQAAGKTAQETFAAIAARAKDSKATRQKGRLIDHLDKHEKVKSGDDVGIAGVRFANVAEALRAEPTVKAPDWEGQMAEAEELLMAEEEAKRLAI